MKQINVLIKPASEKCNLNCEYCFYHDLSSKRLVKDYGLMKNDIMEKVIDRVFEIESLEHVTFSFQGGEPTLIGLKYFDNFIKYVKACNIKNITVNYALQTNGTLLNDDFVKFLKTNNFLLGISLDGDHKTHNKYRKDYSNKNSYEDVVESIQLLDKYNIDYNILSVVTSDMVKNVDRVYKNLRKQKTNYIQFIPCLDPYMKENGKERYSLTPELYLEFLNKLFKLWYQDIKNGIYVDIRFFSNIIGILYGQEPESCDMRGICSIQNIVESNGNVYACDFYVTEAYCLGNIVENDFKTLINKNVAQKFISDSHILNTKCYTCEYKNLCRGGCRRHRSVGSEENLNYYCDTYKQFYFKHLAQLKLVAPTFVKLQHENYNN